MANYIKSNRNQQSSLTANLVNGVQVTPKNRLKKVPISVQDIINNSFVGKMVTWEYHGQKYGGEVLEVHGMNATVDMNGISKICPGFKPVKTKNIHVLPLTRIALVDFSTRFPQLN
jgi:hypothetical protein